MSNSLLPLVRGGAVGGGVSIASASIENPSLTVPLGKGNQILPSCLGFQNTYFAGSHLPTASMLTAMIFGRRWHIIGRILIKKV